MSSVSIGMKSDPPTTPPKIEGGKSFHNALKWAYTATWGDRAFSGLFAFILAAILGPRNFGLVSIAMIYIFFLQMFLDQGFLAALIQRKNLKTEHLDAVFWMDIARSVLLIGVSVLLSGWWAAKNHAPDAARIISVLSLCIPIEGLAAVQAAVLKKQLDFKSLSIRSNVAVVISGVVGIGMALAGFGVWSLVGQQLAKDSTALALLWRLSHWRPRFAFSWRHLKDLTGFSIPNFVAQIGIFGDMQSASILLGLLFGPVAVGLYRLADRLMSSVVSMATTSIQAVSFPEFSRHQDNPAELRKSALTCIRLSSTVTLPALTGLAAVSGSLMRVLGPKWIPASDVLKILCVTGMASVLAFFTGPLLQALSKPHHLAGLEWARTAIGIVILIFVGVAVRNSPMNIQLMGIAFARFCTLGLLVTPVFLFILMRLCRISVRDLAACIAPSAIASAVILATMVLFGFSLSFTSARPLTLLIVETAVGGLAGLVALLLLDTELRHFVVANLQRTGRYPVMPR